MNNDIIKSAIESRKQISNALLQQEAFNRMKTKVCDDPDIELDFHEPIQITITTSNKEVIDFDDVEKINAIKLENEGYMIYVEETYSLPRIPIIMDTYIIAKGEFIRIQQLNQKIQCNLDIKNRYEKTIKFKIINFIKEFWINKKYDIALWITTSVIGIVGFLLGRFTK